MTNKDKETSIKIIPMPAPGLPGAQAHEVARGRALRRVVLEFFARPTLRARVARGAAGAAARAPRSHRTRA